MEQSATGLPIFAVRALDAGETLVLVLEGEADLSCAAALYASLRSAVCDPNRETVIVDLSGCHYMDSAALKTLIGAQRIARERKRTLLFSRPNRNIRRTFEVMQLTQYLTITETPPNEIPA
jgi:anti-anti-sigma factor